MTADKAHEVKAPDAAVVEKALAKQDDGADLSAREQQALADQAQIDRERGYTREEWKPGIWQYRSFLTGHTTADEYAMVQYHAELDGHGIVVPRG